MPCYDQETILNLCKTEIVATTFFLMMVIHPEVVKRAQAEIDSVLGSRRLPNLDDRDKLPYIDCIVKELLRWVLTHLSDASLLTILSVSTLLLLYVRELSGPRLK